MSESFAVALIIEPFYSGSHKQLCDLIAAEIGDAVSLQTLSGKKWHWRARTSSLYFAQTIHKMHKFQVLFASAVLNLAELVALRPDLGKLRKCLYFHENQLVYPVRKQKNRDFQYGYNQIISCLVADVVLFNSKYNMESFLGNLNHFLKLMPDYRPKNLEASIRPKCRVLYFPLNFPDGPVTTIRSAPCSVSKENIVSIPIRGKAALTSNLTHPRGVCDIKNILPEVHKIGLNADRLPYNTQVLHILWPHRWEHDKDPDTFFNVLFELHKENIPFKLSVLGETYQEVPEIFRAAENKLKDQILHYGFLSSKEEYWKVLHSADVVVSTAKHEFFGVAMLEAVYCKCYPLCPKQLVYPEIFPDEYLYSTPNQLFKRLKKFCLHPLVARNHLIKVDLKRYLWSSLKEDYLQVLFGPTEENISMKQIL